jgi:hypothetical protein
MFIFSSHWNLKEKETKNKGRKAINPSSTLAFHKKPKSNQPSSTRFFHSDQIIHHLYLQPPPTFPTFAHLFTSTVTTIIILTNPHWQPHNNQVASIFFSSPVMRTTTSVSGKNNSSRTTSTKSFLYNSSPLQQLLLIRLTYKSDNPYHRWPL